MKKRILSLAVVLILLVSVFASCKFTVDTSGTVRLGTVEHNRLYNPLYWASSYDYAFVKLMYEGLTAITADGKTEVNPLIVDGDFAVSEDQLTYTFKIKKGIKFHQGQELKAKDVVFTYKVMASPVATPRNINSLDSLRGASEYKLGEHDNFDFVEEIDEYTVAFHFKDIQRTNLSSCGMQIISEEYYADIDWENPDEAMNAKMQEPNGTGPYKIGLMEAGQFYTLDFNEEYHAGKETNYKIKQVMNKVINTQLEVEELEADNIDFVTGVIEKSTIDKAKEIGFGLQQYPRAGYGYIAFNTVWGHSADKEMRQAVAYAFDRAAFCESQFSEFGYPIDIPMSPASSIFDLIKGSATNYTLDLDKAKEGLVAGGYVYDGDTLTKDGEPVVLKFYASTENNMIEAMIPVLEDNLKQIGITLDAEYMDFSIVLEKTQAPVAEGWHMYFMATGWTGDEPNIWTNGFATQSMPKGNPMRYSNPEVDTLLEEGRKILDVTSPEAVELYSRIGLILNDELPQIPVYTNTYTDIHQTRIVDFTTTTYHDWTYAMNGMSIDKADQLEGDDLLGVTEEAEVPEE